MMHNSIPQENQCQSIHRSALPKSRQEHIHVSFGLRGIHQIKTTPPNLPAGILPSLHTHFPYHNNNHMHHKSIPIILMKCNSQVITTSNNPSQTHKSHNCNNTYKHISQMDFHREINTHLGSKSTQVTR